MCFQLPEDREIRRVKKGKMERKTFQKEKNAMGRRERFFLRFLP